MTEIIAVPPGITSVILPESITNIGTREFLYGNSLASIIIPASVTSIGNWAFYTCEKLYEIIVDENNLYYSSQDGIIYNKNKTKIISAAQGIIGSVLLPESVKTIGNYAFNNCSKITSITLPVGLSIIEFCAFSGCSGLTSIAIPNSVTRIEDAVFYRCSNLASIVIPNSVYFIGKHVFDTTAWYENQPDGLVYIGKVAYKYKGEMPENTEIILLSDTVTIAGAAFEDCQGLYSIVIPESVICMGNECFARCTSLKEVYLGASVRLSFHNDFLGCSSLENISVSDDSTVHYEIDGVVFYLGEPIYLITNVGEYLYYTDTLWVYPFGKTDFEYVIPYGTTGIMQYAFSGTDNLQTVIIPDTVSIIGFAAFHDSGIREINIPDGIKFIADMTFYNCNSLETIKISESVKRINKDAFFNCTSLTTVYYEGTEEQWNDIVVASGNECLLNATIVYNCGMQYSNEGNSIYWQTKYPSDTNEYAFIYEIMDIAEATLDNTTTIELTGGAYIIGIIDYTLFELTQDDAIDMYYTFLFSQYSYYFLSNSLAYNEQYIYIIIDEEYITYAARQAASNAIANTLASLDAQMALLNTDIEKLYAIYNFIIDEVYYEYEEDGVTPSDAITAHNIVGVLDGSELTNSVCEGYSKAFAYLCNLYGIDCLAIVSDSMNHAWNAVRIGGVWYWIDVTWDDSTSSNNYFLKGNSFLSSHNGIDDWWVYPVVSYYDYSIGG
ncbi:hypothetical protein EOM82_01110 [bacterium]|nr:hypothetical protein [bacterium]